ncbi:MAG: transcriptional regulator, partial [Chloroflexi bacterium RBG_16_56_8]
IIIKMFFGDHPPPHFHAEYGEHEALIEIRTLTTIEGALPPRALGMVVEWGAEHQQELLDLWERASHKQSLYKVPPLK